MKFTLDGAQTIVSLNLEEAREMAKYDHRTSEYWPTLIGERLWFLNILNNIEIEPKRGHWREKIIYSHSYAECSECKTVYGWSETETMKFCKRCGARMDEAEEWS